MKYYRLLILSMLALLVSNTSPAGAVFIHLLFSFMGWYWLLRAIVSALGKGIK